MTVIKVKHRSGQTLNKRHTCLNLIDLIDFSKFKAYRKFSNISRTLVDNKIVDHSDVAGASPVGAAPTTSSFST